MDKKFLGQHYVVEMHLCDAKKLDDLDLIRTKFELLSKDCNLTIIQSFFHKFYPYGVSGIILISESHLSIHTWPEYCYAAVDIYTCSKCCDSLNLSIKLGKVVMAEHIEVLEIKRGLVSEKRTINTFFENNISDYYFLI